jgi:NAD(P)-dependent dehydrogenase (short-subunit alcohol dehydrogenase family)
LVTAAVATAVDVLGKVDSVLANAGVTGSGATPFIDTPLHDWRLVLTAADPSIEFHTGDMLVVDGG